MGAFFCTDVMPSADKLSRCLLTQRVRSTVLQERLLAGRPGRRAASWQLTGGSSLRIAQRHRSEGEMGAFFCADVMPSADKLSRCLLPQRARSTVLQERLLAGRPAGARPRGS